MTRPGRERPVTYYAVVFVALVLGLAPVTIAVTVNEVRRHHDADEPHYEPSIHSLYRHEDEPVPPAPSVMSDDIEPPRRERPLSAIPQQRPAARTGERLPLRIPATRSPSS
ncbi:hypothetical protein ACMATS_05980 [Streptoverticillium reticulum]|uniref:hypothetical protein n=1 Tax=Streptoverticillium reticulum TaxID=1433415 RepID=UPI0039BFBC53